MKIRLLHGLLLFVLWARSGVAQDLSGDEGWTRFRGPNGSGVSNDRGFPIEFSNSRNLVWRTRVRPGKSSPVLTARHVFLTAYENKKLITQCFDRATGRLLWERSETRVDKQEVNQLNNPAAITPATDGENVYVFFKDFGLLSYDATGKLRWKVPLGPFTNSMGLGASPIVAGDSIILVADQIAGSYIAAFDRRNGELRWKVPRQESEGWSTPLLYTKGDSPWILTAGQGQYGAHRLADGKRVFSHPGLSPAMVASPVLDRDTIYAFGYGADHGPSAFSGTLDKLDKNHDGQLSPDEYENIPGDSADHQMTAMFKGMGMYMGNRDGIITKDKWDAWGQHTGGRTGLLAVRLDPESPHDVWRYDKGFEGVIPSPLLYEGVLYVVKNGGILMTFNPATGELFKADRIPGAIGGYTASLVAAEGRILAVSEEGKLAVLRAGRDWEVIAVNDLGEGAFATPALSKGRIYVRTDEALYCFASKP